MDLKQTQVNSEPQVLDPDEIEELHLDAEERKARERLLAWFRLLWTGRQFGLDLSKFSSKNLRLEPAGRLPRAIGRRLRPSSVTQKLKIFHCIPSLGGGGAERQLSYLSTALTYRGLDVHVAYHVGGPNLGRIEASGVTLHQLNSRGHYDPRLLWQLIRTIRRVRPDLIQTWLTQMDIVGGIAAMLTGTPFILSERAAAPAYGRNWKDRIRMWIGERARVIVANSENGRNYWTPRKEPGLVKVIPNAVPVESIKQVSALRCETWTIGPGTEVVLVAGRFSPEKNLKNLLEAIGSVLSERTNAVALLFGQGPLLTELTEIVERLRLQGRVRILGYTTELGSWMQRANVFVSVSLYEGSPNTVTEAATLKCPLVLSDIPGHRELFDDDAVFFVSPDSSSDIARGISESLRGSEKSRCKAEAACARLSRFTVDSTTSQYVSLYETILEGSSVISIAGEKHVGKQ